MNARNPFESHFSSHNELLASLQADTPGFECLANILKDAAGIHLIPSQKNMSLMASRLIPVLRQHSVFDYREYAKVVKSSAKELQLFVEAMTTNTTQFFRESAHFEDLKAFLSSHLASKKSKGDLELRIWCAAASTGQEPYTIAMVASEVLESYPGFQLKFLATDIDQEVLSRGQAGIFSGNETQNIPDSLLRKYFRTKQEGFQVRQDLRNAIRFTKLNLVNFPYPFQHKFDVIFCRNVLIYFDPPTTKKVVQGLLDHLRPDGRLYLGHSETGVARGLAVESLGPAIYRPKKAGS